MPKPSKTPANALPDDGRLDPAGADIATAPKRRRRRARNLPDPPAELREWEPEAERRMFKRAYPPGIILEPAGRDKEHWTAPHSDVSLWHLQLGEAFGTRSRAVLVTFMAQLQALCGREAWDEQAQQWRLDENELSATLALVNSIKPRNEMEAALAAQMVAVHLMTMKVSAYAIQYTSDARTAATAAKLARTFTLQLETLQRLRGRRKTAKQSIHVTKELHQHVHYTDARGIAASDGQAQEPRAVAAGECPALPCPDEGGRIVSLASRKRQGEV